MRKRKWSSRLKTIKPTFPIHPLLFAVFPVLFLYSHNIQEVLPDVVIKPLIAVTIFTFVLVAILNFLIINREKAALLSSLFIVLFFSYGHVANLISDFTYKVGAISIGKYKLLFSAWIITFILGVFLLNKVKRNLKALTNFLTIVSAALVIFSLLNIGFYELKTKRLGRVFESNTPTEDLSASKGNNSKRLDIYYLIFDRYAANNTLQEFYGYDNSNFTNYLKDKGFYVASKASANYPITAPSLASSLNMRYINFLTNKAGEDSSDKTLVYPMLQDYKVWRTLKSRGYKFFHLGSYWQPTKVNRYADQVFIPEDTSIPVDEFSAKLLETTIISRFTADILPGTTASDTGSVTGSINKYREATLRQFDLLAQIPKIEGPKFIFAHILLPHPPYVFGTNCEAKEKVDPKIVNDKKSYLAQLACTNKKIKLLLDQIFAGSKKPPIIILQADEGPYPASFNPTNNFRLRWASPEVLKEKLRILNAYFLPGIKNNQLYSTITPVNSFRLIFNLYLGTKYELLPDKNYIFEDINHLYKYIDVTNVVKSSK